MGKKLKCIKNFAEFKEDEVYDVTGDIIVQTGEKSFILSDEFLKEHFVEIDEDEKSGYKEFENKLNYELDWNFIQSIAERMSENKNKYPPYNWQRKMDTEKIKQALFRHVLEIMKGNLQDDNRKLGHLEAVALNVMFLFYHEYNKL